MRALTLKPHWAHAVAWLGKRIENRKRPIPPALVGQRVAIHAGSEAAFFGAWLDELGPAYPGGRDALRAYCGGSLCPWMPRECERYRVRWEGLTPVQPTGKRDMWPRSIVATAVIQPYDLQPGEKTPPWAMTDMPYWWQLADVITLATPVHVQRGQLGLWGLDDETGARVRAAERAARGGEDV